MLTGVVGPRGARFLVGLGCSFFGSGYRIIYLGAFRVVCSIGLGGSLVYLVRCQQERKQFILEKRNRILFSVQIPTCDSPAPSVSPLGWSCMGVAGGPLGFNNKAKRQTLFVGKQVSD